MPVVVLLLALAVFAQGTSEFMMSGLIPDVAADLHVSVPDAGWLTSAFALGMVVGAPLMAVLARRLPVRLALSGFLSAFLAVHVLGAVTGSFPVLLGTRVVAALCNAGFLAVALAAVASLVGPARTGRATAALLAGTTVACVVGVPAGALLGQAYGWRAAFWAVAAVSLPALLAVHRSVPASPVGPAPRVRAELAVLRRPDTLWLLARGALVNGGTFAAFTYLAPLVTGVARLPVTVVPAVLALFGAGAWLGVTVAGRLADRRPGPVLAAGGTALVAGWPALAAAAGAPVPVLLLVPVLGAVSFAVGSTLIARILAATAPGAPRLAGGLATAAFNVGAALGPALAGLVLDAGAGYRSPPLVAAVLAGSALALSALARRVRATAPVRH